jgi:hypothetical protein
MTDVARTPLPLWCHRGETVAWNLQVVQADGVTPQPLTGLTIWFTAKVRLSDADAAPTTIIRTVGLGITVTDETQGLLTLSLASANTAGLGLGITVLDYSIAVKPVNGDPQYPFYGPLTVYGIVSSAAP